MARALAEVVQGALGWLRDRAHDRMAQQDRVASVATSVALHRKVNRAARYDVALLHLTHLNAIAELHESARSTMPSAPPRP